MTERYVETLRIMTQVWQCDHLGHVNVSFYMGWLGDAAFAMLAMHGLNRVRCAEERLGVAAVRAEVDYRAELRGGELLRMESSVESVGERKIVFLHRLIRIGDEQVAMTARLTGVCLDTGARKSRPFPSDFVERIAAAFDIAPVLPKGVAA